MTKLSILLVALIAIVGCDDRVTVPRTLFEYGDQVCVNNGGLDKLKLGDRVIAREIVRDGPTRTNKWFGLYRGEIVCNDGAYFKLDHTEEM